MTGRGQQKTSPRHCEALLRRSNPVFLRQVYGRSCFLIHAFDICFFLELSQPLRRANGWEQIMGRAGAFVAFHEYEDDNGDEQTELIGIYTTKEKAEAAVVSLTKMPGFADYPNGFSIEFHAFDRTGWTEGFVHLSR
jgi:hypothetical protein